MASHAAALKVGLALMGMSMVGYILGPPLYWHLTEALAAVSYSSASSCPLCACDCSSQPLLTIPEGKIEAESPPVPPPSWLETLISGHLLSRLTLLQALTLPSLTMT
ncbi:hypothetical protein F2Q69_00025881 [Brassica cretica]|uniref:Uncharacterized protein n=1 Tax=Brassica cretica TaxID=69181 RepID=A0A8S9S5R3_BRACR|nr:hypothetical protein F2Q69_00025881 [Brassica cretica]